MSLHNSNLSPSAGFQFLPSKAKEGEDLKAFNIKPKTEELPEAEGSPHPGTLRDQSPAENAEEGAADDVMELSPGPVAILVCHGMGEQVRYETLGDLAKSLFASFRPDPPTIAMLRVNDSCVAHAKIAWRERDPDYGNVKREVHLFEAYWAPLTEGRVTYYETLSFLLQAAWTGIKHSRLFRNCSFERWMFGQVLQVNIGRWTKFLLVIVLAALALIAFAILLITYEAASVVKTLIAGTLSRQSLCHFFSPFQSFLLLSWHGHNISVGSLLFWASVPLSLMARYYITQFAGDVAAYISPYKASKFQSIRDNIQKVGRDAASLVYGFTDANVPHYEKVMIVGHSLGSVLAYDTLNAMINLDLTAAIPQDVIGRTRSLITFGSPLDKTAFIFRNQPNTLNDPLREQMVAASQPLIIDYQFRASNFRWINIFSPWDIISGSLDYYDDRADTLSASKRIQNIQDPQAKTPLKAHVEYWDNDLLRDTLLDEIRRP